MASVIVTGSLVVTGSTFVGSGVVTDGLDFYFDVGNINSFDYINNNKSTLNNIAKGGGNPYISASFNIRTGSAPDLDSISPTSSYTPEFGGCLFVSRSAGPGANQYARPAIIFHQLTAPVTNTQFSARYLDGRSELTLGIWHRVIELSEGSLFYAGASTAAERAFDIYATNNGTTMQARFPNIAIPPVNPVFDSSTSPAGILYRWNYFVCVFNNGTITAYTNGVPGNSVTVTQTTIKSSQSFVAGGSASGPNSGTMIGNIGPVQIYGRALTRQEILQNYHTMKGRFGIYT